MLSDRLGVVYSFTSTLRQMLEKERAASILHLVYTLSFIADHPEFFPETEAVDFTPLCYSFDLGVTSRGTQRLHLT